MHNRKSTNGETFYKKISMIRDNVVAGAVFLCWHCSVLALSFDAWVLEVLTRLAKIHKTEQPLLILHSGIVNQALLVPTVLTASSWQRIPSLSSPMSAFYSHHHLWILSLQIVIRRSTTLDVCLLQQWW